MRDNEHEPERLRATLDGRYQDPDVPVPPTPPRPPRPVNAPTPTTQLADVAAGDFMPSMRRNPNGSM